MYPSSILQWFGAVGIILAVLALCGAAAWWIEDRFRHHDDDDESGRAALWLVFEVLSAIFVVAGLLTCIYSDNQILRAIAGIAMIVLVSTITASWIREGV